MALVASPSYAEPVSHPAGWALGFMLGAPLGLTAKYWLGGPNALDLGFGTGPGVRVHGDYLWGLAQVLRDKSDLTLDLYLGAGAGVGVGPRGYYCGWYNEGDFCDGSAYVIGRVPFGVDARLRKAPVELGLEMAPGLLIGRRAWGLFDVFIFVRFIL
jgi:hypothetical protein